MFARASLTTEVTELTTIPFIHPFIFHIIQSQREIEKMDLAGLFGVVNVNYGDCDEDYEFKYKNGIDKDGKPIEIEILLHLADPNKADLMAQFVWQSAITLSNCLLDDGLQQAGDGKGLLFDGKFNLVDQIRQKNVCELGAGAGLPSLICAKYLNAQRVVVTDYPDPPLIENIRNNVIENLNQQQHLARCLVCPYKWGTDPSPLIGRIGNNQGFDTIIIADCLWLKNAQLDLLKSLDALLHKGDSNASVIIIYMHHDGINKTVNTMILSILK